LAVTKNNYSEILIDMKNKASKKLILIFIIILSVFSLQSVNVPNTSDKKVRNIILFIGDGMGTSQVYGAMTVSEHRLTLESFPFTGFSKTYSFSNYVTDSGAGGTAIACGTKTRNGMIGMSPDSVAVSSILQIAHKAGLATGVVCTASVTDATPASFVAHNINRGNYESIARDFLKGEVDVFIGGGKDNFRKRKDSTDLTIELKKQGFDVAYNIDSLKLSQSDKIAGLLSAGDMPAIEKGRVIKLSEMTKKAIETLSRNKKGFFLMVEGSLIDKNAHIRNINAVLSETIDMDEAIGVAKEYSDKDKETLIIVTADHETGGLSLVSGDLKNHQVNGNFIESGYHTGVMVPVFAYGPGAGNFTGIHENTFFLDEFLKLLNIHK
jgi:alkaline phosphatase